MNSLAFAEHPSYAYRFFQTNNMALEDLYQSNRRILYEQVEKKAEEMALRIKAAKAVFGAGSYLHENSFLCVGFTFNRSPDPKLWKKIGMAKDSAEKACFRPIKSTPKGIKLDTELTKLRGASNTEIILKTLYPSFRKSVRFVDPLKGTQEIYTFIHRQVVDKEVMWIMAVPECRPITSTADIVHVQENLVEIDREKYLSYFGKSSATTA